MTGKDRGLVLNRRLRTILRGIIRGVTHRLGRTPTGPEETFTLVEGLGQFFPGYESPEEREKNMFDFFNLWHAGFIELPFDPSPNPFGLGIEEFHGTVRITQLGWDALLNFDGAI